MNRAQHRLYPFRTAGYQQAREGLIGVIAIGDNPVLRGTWRAASWLIYGCPGCFISTRHTQESLGR